jgi:GNAT superfamily N-acetyltransferase
MDQAAALASFDEHRKAELTSMTGGRFERVGAVVRCVGAEPGDWSGIVWADLDDATAEEVIAEQIRYFAGLGRRFEWKYYTHDRPGDLPDRLHRAGFEPGEPEALMVAEVTDIPADLAPPQDIRIVPVTDAGGVRLLVAVHDEVFGEDHTAFGHALLRRLESEPEAVTPVLAMAGEVPVCGARIDFHPGTEFASLWGGGTLPAWRGKGIYGAMVGYRARLAAERGFRYLYVDAMPPSEPILGRLGFVKLSTTVPYPLSPR